jgi:hypothetical protein
MGLTPLYSDQMVMMVEKKHWFCIRRRGQSRLSISFSCRKDGSGELELEHKCFISSLPCPWELETRSEAAIVAVEPISPAKYLLSLEKRYLPFGPLTTGKPSPSAGEITELCSGALMEM